MKKLLAALLCIAMATATIGLAACSPAASNSGSSGQGGGNEPAAATANVACVNIDINPSIELIVDKNSTVVAVRGANDDGVLLLYGEQTLVGKPLDEALEIIIGYAAQYGFLTADNPVIGAVVNSDNDELLASVKQAINSSITASATATGLSLSVDLDGAFSLYRRLSELKARFPDNKAVQALTVNKLRLALSVSETTAISLEAAIELDETRLLELIANADKTIEEYATNEFTNAKQEALAMYDKVAAIDVYAAYAEVYANHLTNHLLTSYYGAAYQLYASAATGFSALLSVNNVMAEIVNYELDVDMLEPLTALFGLTDLEPLKDANGVVTIKSIEAYADKTFRNTAASELLKQKKQTLTEALNKAEAAIRAEIDKLASEYVAQISKQLEQAQEVYNQIKPVLSSVKESLEILSVMPGLADAVADINAIITDYEDITAKLQEFLKGKNPSVSEFEKLIGEYGEKAAKYLEKINADLTSGERAELATKLAAIEQKHAEEKAVLDETLEDAKTQAIDFLTATKSKLKEKTPDDGIEVTVPDGDNVVEEIESGETDKVVSGENDEVEKVVPDDEAEKVVPDENDDDDDFNGIFPNGKDNSI